MPNSVLIVDDDVDLCVLMRELFQGRGHRAVLAKSLDDLRTQQDAVMNCQVVFIDIDLGPGLPDGIEIFKWLRQRHFAGKIYFFTGHALNHPQVRRALELGKVEVLSKPLTPQQLLGFLPEDQHT